MLTLKLKIKNDIDVSEYCQNYSYMFRKLHANFELSEDKDTIKELRDKYKLDSWMYESCRQDVKTKLSQEETVKNKKIIELEILQKELKKDNFKGKEGRRNKYEITQKISKLNKTIGKPIVFGSKAILKRISFLSNDKVKNAEELIKLRAQFKENRILPIYVVGQANQQSNQKFNFDLINKKLTFKPNRKTKIPIEFYCSDSQHKTLTKLQNKVGDIPISVRLSNDFVCIMFDEERLAGFAFNKTEYFRELKTIPEDNKPKRKECF